MFPTLEWTVPNCLPRVPYRVNNCTCVEMKRFGSSLTWLWPRHRSRRTPRCPVDRCRRGQSSSAAASPATAGSWTEDSAGCWTLPAAWCIHPRQRRTHGTWAPAELYCRRHTRQTRLVEQGLTSHSTQFRSFRRRCFTGQMTRPTVSKHWRTVVSYPDSSQSHQAHLTMLQQNNMHAHTRQWHTKKSKHSEWTQWYEEKSGRLNLWAAPMIVQL